MNTYHFQEVAIYASRSGKCPTCGKRTKRSQKFWQTVNPFNRNEDGTPKSAREVRGAVDAEVAAWVPDFRHDACKEAA